MRRLRWLNNIRARWASRNVEAAVANIPALAQRATAAQFAGEAHPNHRTGDPHHASGQLLSEGGGTITSFHVYPNGDVVFSRGRYPAQHIPQNAESASAMASGGPQHVVQWIPDRPVGYKVKVDGQFYAAHYDQHHQNYFYEYGGRRYYKPRESSSCAVM